MDTYICNFATKVHKIIKTTATSPQKSTIPSPKKWCFTCQLVQKKKDEWREAMGMPKPRQMQNRGMKL